MNVHEAEARATGQARRRATGIAGAALLIAAIVASTMYLHAHALRLDVPDVAHFVTGLGCLALTGLAALAAMLRRWKWAFAIAAFCVAMLILLTITALHY